MGLISRLNGKHKLKKQYHKSLDRANAEEILALENLKKEFQAQRSRIEKIQKEEAECSAEEKILAPKQLELEQAKRKTTFILASEKIKDGMQFIRAGLEACSQGNTEMIEILLKKDKVFREHFFKLHPLHIAAEHNHTAVIKLLCRAGINVEITNNEGERALEVAEAQGHVEAFTLLQQISKASAELIEAVQSGDLEAAKSALEHADLSVRLSGQTALQWALAHQHEAIALYLITSKAERRVLSQEGEDLLQQAIVHQHSFKVIQAIVKTDVFQPEELKTAATLAKHHPDRRIRTYLLEYSEEGETHSAVMHYEGPQWTSEQGWSAPYYNATIKSRFVQVNGQPQLFIVARASDGILLKSYDAITQQWLDHEGGPQWSDSRGWSKAQYCATLQFQVLAGSAGQEKIYLLARQSTFIELWCYEPHLLKWTSCARGPGWTDKAGWDKPQYFETLQTQILNLQGQDVLFLLARHSQGIELWSYRPSSNLWSKHPRGPACRDSAGWDRPQYYSTLQFQAIQTAEGPQLFLLGRSSEGMHLWSYSLQTLRWAVCAPGPAWSDKAGWGALPYYQSIQSQTVNINGEMHLCLMARHSKGIELWSYSPRIGQWDMQPAGPEWNDKQSWHYPCYNTTIQMQRLEGYQGTDTLVIMGRASWGMMAYAYSFEARKWLSLPFHVPLLDKNGWALPQYYSTIQTHIAEVNHQNQLLIVARGARGMQCWSHRIHLQGLRNQFIPPAIEPPSVPDFLEHTQAFLERNADRSKYFLEAAKQGDWLKAEEYLKQGAYINAIDDQGLNALQKAIQAQTLSEELWKGLVEAGIEAPSHLSIASFIKKAPLDTPEAIKNRFEQHCDKAKQYLDQYPTTAQKIQALLAYYYTLSQQEPYALYAFPNMLILSQLIGIVENIKIDLPTGFLRGFNKDILLKVVETSFKQTRAMHYLLNEQPNLKLPLQGFEFVVKSQQLKQRAACIAEEKGLSLTHPDVVSETVSREMPFVISGTVEVVEAFMAQLTGGPLAEMSDGEAIAKALLIYQAQHQETMQAQFKALMGSQMPIFIQEASKNGIITLPPKLTLKKRVKIWQDTHQELQNKIHNETEALVLKCAQEKKDLEVWLLQREKEYHARRIKLEAYLKMFDTPDSEILKQYALADKEIRIYFHEVRAELSQNYHQNKRKANKKFIRNIGAIVAASIVAPHLAASLSKGLITTMGITTASTATTVGLMVEGALMGSLTATFSGNSQRILKDGFMGGWMAGFGSVVGNTLKASTTVQRMDQWFKSESTLGKLNQATRSSGVATQAIVSGLKAAIYTGMEGGRLTDNLLLSIGNTVALGSVQNVNFVQSLNEKLTSAVVSAAVTSLITRSNLLDNAASIGLATLAQTAGDKIGNAIMDHRAQLKASPSKERPQPPNEEAHHKKQFSKILKKTSREASDWLSGKGIQKSPLEIETAIQKENALQGQYSEVKAKLTALGNVEDSSLSELNALSKGFQKVVMSVLEKMVSPAMAHEPSLSKPIEAIPQKSQPSFLHMFYRAVKGDKGPEVIEWQQGNRRKMPSTARYADAHRAAQEAFGATQKGRRILGGLQAVGGVGQTVGGMLSVPVNPVLGVPIASMGVDNVVAGLKTAWRGEFQDTYLLRGLTAVGQQTELYGPTAAALIDIGLNMLPAPSSMKWLNTGQTLAKAKTLPAPKSVFSEVKLIEQAASSLTPLEKGNLDFFIQWQNSRQAWVKTKALPVPKVLLPEIKLIEQAASGAASLEKGSSILTAWSPVKNGIITPAGAMRPSQPIKNIKLNAKSGTLGKAREVNGGFIGPATQAAKAKHHAEISKKGAYSSEIRAQGKKDPQWELTDHGLYYPVPLLPREKGMIRGYGALRNACFKWIEKQNISEIFTNPVVLRRAKKTINAAKRSMQEDDLAAIFKEGRGVKIFDKNTDKLLDHGPKALEAQNSMKNLIIEIKNRLHEFSNSGQYNTKEAKSLQKLLSHFSKVKDEHLKIMKESKCLSILKKLKLLG